MCNFAPALARLVHRNEIVEGQTRSIRSQRISQQVRVPQFAPAKPRRRPLRLQRIDRNAGLIRDSRHDSAV